MGEGELEMTERVFQSMKAVLRTKAKLSTCTAVCRGWLRREGGREESIVPVTVDWPYRRCRGVYWRMKGTLAGKIVLVVSEVRRVEGKRQPRATSNSLQ